MLTSICFVRLSTGIVPWYPLHKQTSNSTAAVGEVQERRSKREEEHACTWKELFPGVLACGHMALQVVGGDILALEGACAMRLLHLFLI